MQPNKSDKELWSHNRKKMSLQMLFELFKHTAIAVDKQKPKCDNRCSFVGIVLSLLSRHFLASWLSLPRSSMHAQLCMHAASWKRKPISQEMTTEERQNNPNK